MLRTCAEHTELRCNQAHSSPAEKTSSIIVDLVKHLIPEVEKSRYLLSTIPSHQNLVSGTITRWYWFYFGIGLDD